MDERSDPSAIFQPESRQKEKSIMMTLTVNHDNNFGKTSQCLRENTTMSLKKHYDVFTGTS
jgi:hypothetical protein